MKIFVVICDVGKEESDIVLCKAFYTYPQAQGYVDRRERKLTSDESHIFYGVEEIELDEEDEPIL
jgi:hypothetical protein